MITCSNVSKTFKGFHIGQLSLEIPDGYICGLAGRNGAGKTTLLHLLLGLYQPEEGQILIDQKTYETAEKEIRNLIGTVLVEELFAAGISAGKNGEHYGRFYSGYSKETYHEYLDKFHIPARKRFSRLSKGEKLKCQFAFALACHPKYLILDEPTANFDPEFRETFWKILRDFAAGENRTVLLATHLTDDLDRMADYLLYMDDGKLIYAGDMEQFRESCRILSGEAYKIKLLDKDLILAMEETPYGAKALVRHKGYNRYDETLEVTYPSIEEFMYYTHGAVHK